MIIHVYTWQAFQLHIMTMKICNIVKLEHPSFIIFNSSQIQSSTQSGNDTWATWATWAMKNTPIRSYWLIASPIWKLFPKSLFCTKLTLRNSRTCPFFTHGANHPFKFEFYWRKPIQQDPRMVQWSYLWIIPWLMIAMTINIDY